MIRLLLLAALALLGLTAQALAQGALATDKPVTPPNSFRVLMENERVRMIELNISAHSKVDVESPPGRERFLYMLTDGALVLAPPGKTPNEFALHAGETAVFPAVSPTVENDSDQTVRAVMVELKQGGRVAAPSEPRGRRRHARAERTREKARARKHGKPSEKRPRKKKRRG